MVTGRDSERGDEPGTVTFLYLGRLASEKAVGELIRAAELVGETETDWRLRIAGDGPERESLEELVQICELGSRVEFFGEVDSSVRAEVLVGADVFVLPSHRDAWGLVVNEALSAGLPVIAPSWVGAASDLLLDGYDGLVLASNSADEIAGAMAFLLEYPGRIPEMGKRGREIVVEGRWTLEGALDGVADLLAGLR